MENIGIYLEPGYHYVLAMLSIMKSGATFVPMDVNYPLERISILCHEAKIKIIVTTAELSHKILGINILQHVIIVEDKNPSVDLAQSTAKIHVFQNEQEIMALPVKQKSSLDNLYIIFTSGTTGKPKGVPITHENLLPLMLWQKKHFNLNSKTKTLQMLSLSFDFGVQEVLTTLLFGGTLHFVDMLVKLNASELAEYIQSRQITMLYLTPEYAKNVFFKVFFPSLKVILLGGQTLEFSTLRLVQGAVTPACDIFNGYGPTEVSINVAMYKAVREPYLYSVTVPIGTVSANNKIYILDEQLKPVPSGTIGEIYLGGIGVSSGYINNRELNQSKFLDNPFIQAEKIYRTGDYAKRLPDKNIEFLSRKDDQCKVRGYRIELAEIEYALSQHSDVENCSAVASSDSITLFFMTHKKDCYIHANSLNHFLANTLPTFMLPDSYIQLEAIPLTPNGKTDKKALLELAKQSLHTQNSFSSSTGLNIFIDAWKDILNIEHVNPTNNFFELGGDSISAIRLHAQLEKALNLTFSLVAIFQYPTPMSLANFLVGNTPVSKNTDNARYSRRRDALTKNLRRTHSIT